VVRDVNALRGKRGKDAISTLLALLALTAQQHDSSTLRRTKSSAQRSGVQADANRW
jgi:hypothetical protein